LLHPDVERVWRGASGDDQGSLPFLTGYGNAPGAFAHEDGNVPVEQVFQRRAHASPMGRRSDDEQVRITDLVGQIVSVVVRQRALARFAASHASRAGSDPAVVDMDQLGVRPESFRSDSHHRADRPVSARATVDYQRSHPIAFLFRRPNAARIRRILRSRMPRSRTAIFCDDRTV